jgi:UDP:flavonoid glycosyltransferase YjiC (YdhE family)
VLAHGLPSLALPQSADNFVIATRLAEAGVAHGLMPGDVTTAAVLAGLRSVLGASNYRQRARELAGEIAAMPSHDEVAARLRAKV